MYYKYKTIEDKNQCFIDSKEKVKIEGYLKIIEDLEK